MIVVNNETFRFELYKRVENSPYEWEEEPTMYFNGRPANRLETKSYRLNTGVNTNNDSIFIVASNLPKEVQPFDKVKYLGKLWTVESVGYYFDSSYLVNAKIMNDNYIMNHSPKGITLS